MAPSDPRAFMVIFDRHFDAIDRFLRRQIGPSDAEDAAAEVFLRALQHAGSYEPRSSSARPWLLGIATNVARGIRRAHHSDRLRTPLELVPNDLQSVADARRPEAAAWLAEVRGALDLLPEEERTALLLYAWADLSYEEIAVALGSPVGTIRSRIARGRGRLRTELKLSDWEEVAEP